MIVGRFFGKTGRGLAVAAATVAAIGLTTVPRPANAGGIGLLPTRRGVLSACGVLSARTQVLEPLLPLLLRLLSSRRAPPLAPEPSLR